MKYLFVLLMLVAMSASAQTYKCKRPDGKISFQDQPCEPGSKGDAVYIPDPSPSYDPAAVPQKAPAPASTARRDRIFGAPPNREDEALRERNRQLEAENRALACNSARRSLAALQTQRPAYRTDASGNKAYIEDGNRAAELAAAQQNVSESCR
ncbi:hypothetical protein BWI17_02640 [Betaproteobacteria bacterium GR16-43]|nr:hypothetical protein BWI17_02640 [Betaproteobacteria bacterium GR16-43]